MHSAAICGLLVAPSSEMAEIIGTITVTAAIRIRGCNNIKGHLSRSVIQAPARQGAFISVSEHLCRATAAEKADLATEGRSSFRTSRESHGESSLQRPKQIMWSRIGLLEGSKYPAQQPKGWISKASFMRADNVPAQLRSLCFA
ncbi:hypothetical protein mRhiFer1_009255 [Rhinolophus ferrumequinum]|uniref:Uncharacterized protein n=1 Tax=Rhinolophus ferrumequinum TaxID=59479 RepID=A0A7J7S7X6_RHIFE|nr:hypothetical protein mRhiFer1_009255 [Rhinolophus ferrumequinum]